MKIGAGPVRIETSEGWLLFYHGVLRSCNVCLCFRFGAAGPGGTLEGDGPQQSVSDFAARPYECMGDVPNVTFPALRCTIPRRGAWRFTAAVPTR